MKLMISRRTKQIKSDWKRCKNPNYTKSFEKHWEIVRELPHPNKTLHGNEIMGKLIFKKIQLLCNLICSGAYRNNKLT